MACSQPTSRPNNKPSLQLPFQQLQQLCNLHLQDINLLGDDAGTADQNSSEIGNDRGSDTDSDADSGTDSSEEAEHHYDEGGFHHHASLPASNPFAPLAASLTSLSLKHVRLFGAGFDRLGSLSVLTALQQLRLDCVRHSPAALGLMAGARIYPDTTPALIPGTTLSHLTNLTSVRLGSEDCSDSKQFAAVCRLPNLRELSYDFPCYYSYNTNTADVGWSQMPMSLTSLHLRGLQDSTARRSAPGWAARLAQLTQLQKLQLHKAGSCCTPDVLAGVLQQLSELQHFELEYDLKKLDREFHVGFDREHCKALACCTGLTYLALIDVAFEDYKAPSGHWQQGLFVAGHTFPCLQTLRLRYTDDHQGYSLRQFSEGPQELQLLSECCPMLRQLDVTGAVVDSEVPEDCWTALLQVTSLAVGDVGDCYKGRFADIHGGYDVTYEIKDKVMCGLAKLVQLRELCLNTCQVTWAGCRALTALTALTRLYMSSADYHKDRIVLTTAVSGNTNNTWRAMLTMFCATFRGTDNTSWHGASVTLELPLLHAARWSTYCMLHDVAHETPSYCMRT